METQSQSHVGADKLVANFKVLKSIKTFENKKDSNNHPPSHLNDFRSFITVVFTPSSSVEKYLGVTILGEKNGTKRKN